MFWLITDLPTITIAAGAYQPEDSYSSLDFSMPKYNVENTGELLGISNENPSAEKAEKKATKRTSAIDPAKEAARAQKEAAQAAAQKAKRQADMQKKIAAKEKMEAKKAERAAFQQR